MLNFINKLFGGSKSEKDVKKLSPVIDQINQHFQSYQSLSNDDLRAKTVDFRQRIATHVKEITTQISDLKTNAETTVDIHAKSDLYKQIDQLVKTRDTQLEEILLQLLPEAFATVKAASQRFKENTEIFKKK